MRSFTIKVRTTALTVTYSALALTASAAFMDAAEAQGDEPCGITVTPA